MDAASTDRLVYRGTYKEPVLRHNRVLIIDYDGLLSTKDAVPELSRPSPFVTSCLVQLAANPSNLLVVLSGQLTQSCPERLAYDRGRITN